MENNDVQELRNTGFNEAEISIAVQVIGYFNYINRIADGLGVEPEDWMTIGVEAWKAEKASF